MSVRSNWMRKLAGLAGLCCLLLGPLTADAAFYKCYREDGKPYYTDKGCGNDLAAPQMGRPSAAKPPQPSAAPGAPVAPPPGAPVSQPLVPPGSLSAAQGSAPPAEDDVPADTESAASGMDSSDESNGNSGAGMAKEEHHSGGIMFWLAVAMIIAPWFIMVIDAFRSDRMIWGIMLIIVPGVMLLYPFFRRTGAMWGTLLMPFVGAAIIGMGSIS